VRRGEVWRVLVLGRVERTVVIVGHDALTDTRDDVLCVQVQDTPGMTASLVTVRVDDPVVGYARAASVGPLAKKNFAERLGAVSDDALDQIDIALRAALDL
jgi:mRNA-degrading endonuclease toxin of MazEF toxin-antitoxin module